MNYNRIVYDHDLPHRAVAVYMYLCDRSNKVGKCFPSIQTIKTDLKLSKSTVIRALHDLERAGLIAKEERWRTNGGQSSTLYTLSQ